MNWEAIGAIEELPGATVLVLALVYWAVQVKHAKVATADDSQLIRANGARDVILEMCSSQPAVLKV
jgi:hypothetical protein